MSHSNKENISTWKSKQKDVRVYGNVEWSHTLVQSKGQRTLEGFLRQLEVGPRLGSNLTVPYSIMVPSEFL